ncbi:MAG: universal stress protein [Gammaproteobacteria bacterium]|nr:universal stress protein [Gammaproteobacteria bacterium]
MITNVSICVNNLAKSNYAALAACRFAERHNASISAVYIKLDTVEIVRWSGSSPIDLADQILVNESKLEEDAKDLFESLSQPFSCEKVWKTVNQSEDPVTQLLCTDLIFADQPTGEDLSYFGDKSFLNHLILQTKRPVVMIPDGWDQAEMGTSVLLGWNKSAEAMRAVADALPILQSASETRILQIASSSMFHAEPTEAPDIEAYLLGKGVESDLTVEGVSKHESEEATLLKWAADNNINLIVIGGYGHSRWREVVMGGMTSHLIAHSTIPVLLSH